MINSVTVTNPAGESIKLELRFPEKSGFLVRSISGLGPVKATIGTTELATSDGAIYNSARLSSRNIVLQLVLMDTPSVETVRQKSYKYFPVKKKIKLLIETENRICEIYGFVETNEPNIFSSQVSTTISIVCPDPYFYSAGEDGNNITIFAGIEDLFEFPFWNDSLTENLIEFGDIVINQEETIFYQGDADVGVLIYIHALGDATNLTIYNTGSQEIMRIDTDRLTELTGFGIITGDDIVISTIRGQKSITLIRTGVAINILNCLDKDADWFQLVKGDNLFVFSAETGGTNLQFMIENQTVYEGV